jgi:hypothetical protein
VADIRADASGHWSIDQASPVGVGPHRFRVDQVDAGGRVLARAEIMFEMVLPGATASLPDVADKTSSWCSPARTSGCSRALPMARHALHDHL